jgi:hypothetical protein
VDASGALYVTNDYHYSVTKYLAGQVEPAYTITQNVSHPISIALYSKHLFIGNEGSHFGIAVFNTATGNHEYDYRHDVAEPFALAIGP